MISQQSSFDVLVIGGGAAGIMAALSARKHHPDYSVAIVDRTFELGRKFLTSGAGRGNLTNVNLLHGPKGFFHGDQAFIESIFSQYGYADILKFFEKHMFAALMEQTIRESQLAKYASRLVAMDRAEQNIQKKLGEMKVTRLKITHRSANKKQQNSMNSIFGRV